MQFLINKIFKKHAIGANKNNNENGANGDNGAYLNPNPNLNQCYNWRQ